MKFKLFMVFCRWCSANKNDKTGKLADLNFSRWYDHLIPLAIHAQIIVKKAEREKCFILFYKRLKRLRSEFGPFLEGGLGWSAGLAITVEVKLRFPSCLNFASVSKRVYKCETIHMKMSSTCSFIFLEISHFHKNGFALRLVLEQRHKGTRKWALIQPMHDFVALKTGNKWRIICWSQSNHPNTVSFWHLDGSSALNR